MYDITPTRGARRTVVYMHGGAYVRGITGVPWWFAAWLAPRTGVRVTVPIYPSGATGGAREVVSTATTITGDAIADHGGVGALPRSIEPADRMLGTAGLQDSHRFGAACAAAGTSSQVLSAEGAPTSSRYFRSRRGARLGPSFERCSSVSVQPDRRCVGAVVPSAGRRAPRQSPVLSPAGDGQRGFVFRKTLVALRSDTEVLPKVGSSHRASRRTTAVRRAGIHPATRAASPCASG